MPRCLFRPFIVISVLILYFSLFAYDLTKSLDNGVTMTPKRRAINLSWFFTYLAGLCIFAVYVLHDFVSIY